MFSRGISELVLIVSDVREAAQFYREVVGLSPEREADDRWAWFWGGDAGKGGRIALHKGPLLFEEHSPLPDGERWGQVHFALEVPRSGLDAAVAHIRAHGVKVHGPKRLDWMRAESYYFYDLDGNLLELWSPDPAAGERGPST
jgi:catechol-2,3-dioxygenase